MCEWQGWTGAGLLLCVYGSQRTACGCRALLDVFVLATSTLTAEPSLEPQLPSFKRKGGGVTFHFSKNETQSQYVALAAGT